MYICIQYIELNKLTESFETNSSEFQAAREVIRRYLLEFRLLATEIYEGSTKNNSEDIGCIPTLLQILYHLEPMKYEIETIVSIYKMINAGENLFIIVVA